MFQYLVFVPIDFEQAVVASERSDQDLHCVLYNRSKIDLDTNQVISKRGCAG
jgi:hypothetical protein